ncbi:MULTISPECIES: thioredoxin TrxC [Acidithiobacillus]|uniref:Thioredoxin n=1 Tax=Acidithiobacillus thiooxidans ATCC 19377 TaxID=637390 RepID=A0A5P9XU47_ACITH|nr:MULTISPECIES: thioredoxin TrxC [Acidithiobacillus]MBU2741916.1 thioredoxin TrxC [Acidithiobacillus albertensis]MBU2835211.1 thioredoxin TrxC [Acidithiobacillus thiooxidans]MDA8177469.1 thioredoxin TrxC [Acidithiobacillus sp.]QFX97189.1 thiol reductase thioredoxin [Acidithiobacillus thiooxidans ATCC 19377]
MKGLMVVCPSCGSLNRVPQERLGDKAKCGKCHAEILPDHPVNLAAASFNTYIQKNELPVLVDFWAPWCGPCRSMAPQFEQAGRTLRGRVLFAKVNTEEEQSLGARFQIRSIPSMVLFKIGKEYARVSGAMGAADIQRWLAAQGV